jgi:ABC-type iron transport system FetAB ATPase subunit
MNLMYPQHKSDSLQKLISVADFFRMRYAQLVMGPAGSGKSTYCAAVAAHAQVNTGRLLWLLSAPTIMMPVQFATVATR